MTFKGNQSNYRVLFDTKHNLFIIVDATNEQQIAQGITIERALKELQKTA